MGEAPTLEEAVDAIAETFSDGFQVEDLMTAIPHAMQVVASFEGLSGAEKKEKVIHIVGGLLDKFDLPGPDWITKKVIMWFIPGVIDKLVDAANGRFSF
jgi:hypothetical protein